MMVCEDILGSLLTGADVLEIGANCGHISEQILEFKPRKLIANEINQEYEEVLRNRFKDCANFDVSIFDILNLDLKQSDKYDVVILKEIINALPGATYDQLVCNAIELLEGEGSLVIIDYVPFVSIRQCFCRLLLKPLNFPENWKQFTTNKAENRCLSKKQLLSMFDATKYSVQYHWPADPFNRYDTKTHRFLEKIIPCKYMAVIEVK